MRTETTRNRTHMKCKSCGEPYNPQVGCSCWATSRSNAIATFEEILKKGGCKACGSRAHFPQEKPGEICPECDRHEMNRQTSISAIAAGICPVCYGLPHRRDMEHCTGCGEEYAPISPEDIEAWAGYAVWPVEHMLQEEHVYAEQQVECPRCGELRAVRIRQRDVQRYNEMVMCRSCAVAVDWVKKKRMSNEPNTI